MALPSNVPLPSDFPDISQQIDFILSIDQTTFVVVVSVLFALTWLSIAGRIAVAVYCRRRLATDDYTLAIGCMTFTAATGVLYALQSEIFELKYQLSRAGALKAGMGEHVMQYTHAFSSLLWSTLYAVKFSFLAFFYQIVRSQKDILRYFWVVVGITAVSGAYEVVSFVIFCPHNGMSSIQCFLANNQRKFNLHLGWTVGLDMLTDLLIASIPILVLRRTSIRLTQKLIVGTFLSLSLVMVVIASIRVAKMSLGGRVYDTLWNALWLYIEGAIAILMASLTVYRALFNIQRETRRSNERLKKPPTFRGYRRDEIDDDDKENLTQTASIELVIQKPDTKSRSQDSVV